jgi:uroporphyrinogen-III synthase
MSHKDKCLIARPDPSWGLALFKGQPVKQWLKGVTIACIGPITADTARDLGLQVDIQPKDFTVAALAKEIAEGVWDLKNKGA